MINVSVKQEHFLPERLNVIVTGASSGIGLAQVQAFLNKGHQVVGVDCQPFPASVEVDMQSFNFIQADISQLEDAQLVLEFVNSVWDSVHVLCNTAGQLDQFKRIDTISLEDWEHFLNVNVTSQFLMCQAFIPKLLEQSASRIINMASIAGLTAGGGGVAYSAAKHAVVGLTKQLAYDYASTGLRVNAIAPGAIQTAMTQADFDNGGEMAQWVAEQTPMKRWAQPEEVANVTLFLASDAADYMQGTVLQLDGGWLIR
ncbi:MULTISPECIES: 3-oxoacyl-ACP reductase [unclassified Facklamia]|uniref:3-oxoacyl-ACP reductase n=1 Tax=Aerococcaceae TaxID=186827 RepID=UPI0013B61900|nr:MULTISPECIES: 3-oxoacyl-ACP reductase [unclassified Facklamia]NEW63754.1 3-oxoacyl-ACP reductase [Facklamia sp. 252]NEW67225.1 3-oxoacyl-ACP reductase [Facklamia sp. 253]QQD66238.1 3-oxoacyl-ACP reductase [Aerococcaceae bacterium zg-252]